ncbi:MAG: response regulator [Ahrensia sp.]|nr:response regulator [Ahrensia sp.]
MAAIVIIEDDFILGEDMATALKSRLHDVEVLPSASQALNRCCERAFDLAIVDIFIMKDGSFVPDGGLSFISRLRHNTELMLQTRRNIPIIAISGGLLSIGGGGPLQNARDIGASSALTKPFKMIDLVKEVKDLLA